MWYNLFITPRHCWQNSKKFRVAEVFISGFYVKEMLHSPLIMSLRQRVSVKVVHSTKYNEAINLFKCIPKDIVIKETFFN